MSRLPDLEGWTVFAKVAESGSFARAAEASGLSKATVSKAVARLEARIGAALFNRTSRRLALTDTGRAALAGAARILAEAETLEADALARAATPSGLVRLAAPMSFGVAHVAPLLPAFLASHPAVRIDLHLSDALVDLVGGGYDVALRIGALADSSLRARRLCRVRLVLVASPDYLARHGTPGHPRDLAAHACLGYGHLPRPERWRLLHPSGEEILVTPSGPLSANNGDALCAALLAGLGLALLPEFMIWRDLSEGRLAAVLGEWSMPGTGLYVVTPPGGPRPSRVTALIDFLARRLVAAPWASAGA